jgi:glycosyltransferase involved in cell wall biosynthesis
MRLSIAMCTYNGAAYLPEQLESLAAQTRAPDEVVVCDDNSTEGRTVEIVRAFALNSPFEVRFSVNPKTLGSKMNFENAIARCEGDVIFLCDQDDVWNQNKLARVEAAFLAAPEAGFVFSDAEVVDEDLQSLSNLCDGFKEEFPAGQPVWIFRSLLPVNLVTGATMAFRSTFRDLVLPIPHDTVFQQDGWIALIIAAVAPAVFLNEPLVKYRQHSAQQIGVSIAGTKYERRESPLIDAVNQHPYPTAEIHAFKTAYERLATKGSTLATAENMADLRAWLTHLEKDKAHLENENARARKHGGLRDSRAMRVASYIWKDIFRQ